MLSKWDRVGRLSLDIASAATSIGFSAAKQGTKLGFAVTRGVASSAAGLTGSVLDHAVFGGNIGAGPALEGFVSSAISAVESLTLVPIVLGESLASTTLVAAHSYLSVMQAILPGSDEASFSLASFVTLVRREWNNDMQDSSSPEQRYGFTEVLKALVAWATVQGKTSSWQEQRWFKCLKEIELHEERTSSSPAKDGRAAVHFTRNTTCSNQILTADIGEASTIESPFNTGSSISPTGSHTSVVELGSTLRRFSRLVLAGYGGASLLFFGVPPVPTTGLGGMRTEDEKAQLTKAVNSSEHEAAGCTSGAITPDITTQGTPSYSWWDMLRGKHDADILLHYAASQTQSESASLTEFPKQQDNINQPAITATFGGNGTLMPRFWVLTDHARREIVLVLRGTMSLNELAVDLTCDPADFHLHEPTPIRHTEGADEEAALDAFEEELENMPGAFPMDFSMPFIEPTHRKTESRSSMSSEEDDTYQVHGGILKMAKTMGSRGKSVHITVRRAMKRNAGYNLVICGHSLGAGVAALLALMWADPWTCLTHRSSGLPSGRHVAAYCYAPPCLVSARLSRIAALSNLITSFVYSHDIVSRLSLGSVRDLRRAASWLCEAEKDGTGDGYGGVTARALKAKTGFGKHGDEEWFLSIRKTLEANMHMAHLYPPGRVLWALRDDDLEPEHRLRTQDGQKTKKLRLFEVQDVEQVFGQISFAKDMLSSHLPHQYDRALHELH